MSHARIETPEKGQDILNIKPGTKIKLVVYIDYNTGGDFDIFDEEIMECLKKFGNTCISNNAFNQAMSKMWRVYLGNKGSYHNAPSLDDLLIRQHQCIEKIKECIKKIVGFDVNIDYSYQTLDPVSTADSLRVEWFYHGFWIIRRV